MLIFLFLAIYLVILDTCIPERLKMKKSIWASLGFVMILALRSPYCGLDVTGSTSAIMPASYGGVFLSMHLFSFRDIITSPGIVNGGFETGWLLLTKFISLFTNNLQLYLAIIALLHFIPIAYIIGKYSSNIILSYFIFAGLGFYIHFFSGIRQMMALSVLLLAFDQLYNKRYLWFCLIVIIASTIHSSALLFIVLLPLSFIHISSLFSIVVLGGLIILSPIYVNIVSRVLDLFFESNYLQYLNEGGQAITLLFIFAILYLTSFLNKENSIKNNLLRIVVFTGVVCQSLGMAGAGSITRIGYYFNVYFMLLLPEVVVSFQRNVRILVTIVAIILLSVFFTLITTDSSGIIPYKFFWQAPVVY